MVGDHVYRIRSLDAVWDTSGFAGSYGVNGPLPRLIDLAAHWREIAAEAAALPDTRLDIARAGKTHAEVAAEIIAAGRPGWVEGWRPGWLNWGVCINDQFPIDCGLPFTVSALRQVKGIKVAALSLMEPGCTLLMHSHDELAGRYLTFHLGLDCPDQGAELWAGGGFLQERNGNWLVFDGSRPHYAFNCSEQRRVILYVEFERGEVVG
jgi:aspartyl/asparaginyl beta-hydroxylase (cupin superfamily)